MKGAVLLFLWSVSLGAQATFDCQTDDFSEQILKQRQAFNSAIVEADIEGIKSILADKATLVTGTDSLLINGKQAQLAIWNEEFLSLSERLIYQRNTDCVHVNPNKDMAMELGEWQGKDKENKGVHGLYSAKWRRNKTSQVWELEAEIYMTKGALE